MKYGANGEKYMTCNLFKRRIPAAVLAAAMLFSLTACGDFGNTVFSELGIGRETGQADGDDPADSAGVKDSPVIIPSFRVGNENSQDLSRGDGKGTNSAGSQAGQAGDGGEGQQTGAAAKGRGRGGSKDRIRETAARNGRHQAAKAAAGCRQEAAEAAIQLERSCRLRPDSFAAGRKGNISIWSGIP